MSRLQIAFFFCHFQRDFRYFRCESLGIDLCVGALLMRKTQLGILSIRKNRKGGEQILNAIDSKINSQLAYYIFTKI